MTQQELKLTLFYVRRTGKFYWRNKRKGAKVGCAAGSRHSAGYRTICINGTDYLAHRLAWLYHYGEWPKGVVDHMNGRRNDNRIENLRDTTQSENTRNVVLPRSDNTTGFRGVSLHKPSGKYTARIKTDDSYLHLGLFKTKEQAAWAYAVAKVRYHNIAMQQNVPYPEAA